MKQHASHLTNSRYYSPAFNAAIFDGPIRIYFAQYQEALALRVYFRMHERIQGWLKDIRPLRSRVSNVFIMLYPTDEIFVNCFSAEQVKNRIVMEKLGDDFVLGICGSLREEDFDDLIERVGEVAATWRKPTLDLGRDDAYIQKDFGML